MTEQVESSQALEAARTAGRNRTRSGQIPPALKRATGISFIYLRVSTKEQARTGGGAEGYSIPAQREACYAKAQQLGVSVHEEYVDAGESARSADREQLQKLLKDIKTIRPDYVIVHKIDRLARNREDDIAINLMLRKHGVKLISCTENIDDTPSGRLLHGLMAEIAQFYSGNLAQEVMKGLVRKAQEGGTPFRAPIGYLNRREMRTGVEFSWVELDPERAPLIRWCLEEYSTGQWSALDLTLAARAKGLASRPTPNRPAKPISITTMYKILNNPYYMGVVSYQGIHYEGKHPALIEPETWLANQAILAAHNHTGEKDRTHNHYLRSTIYCSDCGGRLVYSANKGNGGTYVYYMCVKKKTKTNNCTRPAVRVERIEAGIAAFYRHFKVKPEHAEQIRQAVKQELATQQAEARRSLERATARKTRVTDERHKLLQAHYAGAVPQDLLGSEMQRLTRELAEAETEIKTAKVATSEVENTLNRALVAASRCEQAYLTAPDHVKRQINRGFFEKLFIDEDGSVWQAAMTEPFASLIPTQATGTKRESDVTMGDAAFIDDGVKQGLLVPPTGLEPALNRF
ncbi:recombinase family protein [Amycolatopsis mediterranei]|uniref:recombinase family protein n=1 Tax=Amycolatopsis mediterranei TaxID=33910 RepID=UPI003431CA44